MMKNIVRGLLLILVFVAAPRVQARQWTDASGIYHIDAELIGFNGEMAILQRSDGELGSILIKQLSEKDQKYLESKEAQDIHSGNLDELQNWTMQSGLKVPGRIVDYTKREVTIQRRRGKIYVNQTVYENLPNVYQRMLPRIVETLEGTGELDEAGFPKWVRDLRGQAKSYLLEGVVLELENGDEYAVPFFLFSLPDQEILKPGWEQWAATQSDYEKQDEQAFRLQSMAAAYQQNQQIRRQVATLHLNMQAIQSGLTSAWEVTLYPRPGTPSPPRWVVTMGRDSRQATQAALMQNPGFVAGPVRRVSR